MSGQAQVPVLRHGRKVIAGSAHIIDYLEQLVPEPPLYPHDPDALAEAREIQAWFDAELGPAVQPPEGPTYPEPRAAVVDRWTARWADHPGAAWVREIYRRHRGQSAEIHA
jgi:glutathione S-transferase